ncbi:PP2C family protein-serine/threonine phosphatase [uncultured Paludibaculum sp.]|uniref:PP2C family protein-serine/threonine phosphatase n=1 Tax=uncultured Paludibaculum sp. TaxID=1765020 RepID=UPI002AAB315F|nr:PP2C family protein-serine/threonine phosphatase [uncultured Paludibaculum sp.]
MNAGLDFLQRLALLVWLAVLLLFLSSLTAFFFSSRRVRLDIVVSWYRNRPLSRNTMRPLLLTVAVAIVCALLVQISPSETPAMRIALMVVGAGVTWVSFDWSWKQLCAAVQRQSDANLAWRDKTDAALSELRLRFEPGGIRQAACDLIARTLGARHVYLYTRAGDSFSLSASMPLTPESDVSFSVASLLRHELTSGHTFRCLRVMTADGRRPRRWSKGMPARLEAEQSLLMSVDAHVVAPVQSGAELSGFFILGPHMEVTGYSGEHLRFAEAVARQMVASLAVAELFQAELGKLREVAQDQASRRAARTTRTHLIPPDRFELPDLDFAAEHWTGDLPGGAFYDIVSVPNRAAAFFLAEVPGPDEEAAARMVQLQTLLRTRARAYTEDLAELLESTQRALGPSAANRPPIGLFCARYVSGSGRLQYLNAGAYPPVLIRRTAEGAEIMRLTCGGAPIGAGPEGPRQVGEVEIRSGDLLAIGSAGLAQAPGLDGETWGEPRYIDTLQSWESQRARDIVHLTLHSVHEFSGKNPQVPPRLLIVLRPN